MRSCTTRTTALILCALVAGCGDADSDDGFVASVDCRTQGYECTSGFSCEADGASGDYYCAPVRGSGSQEGGNPPEDTNNGGSPPERNEPDPGCRQTAECRSEEICVSGDCREMWDRSYTITVLGANAGEGDPNGEYWDGAAGAPDFFVSVRLDGESIGVTSVEDNTYSPQWNESFSVRLFRTTSLSFRVIDEDVSSDDLALDLSVEDLGDLIAGGGGSYSSSVNLGITSFDFAIDPR